VPSGIVMIPSGRIISLGKNVLWIILFVEIISHYQYYIDNNPFAQDLKLD
jgi:hypothetical protein